jgi:hypothetical protein
MHVRATLDKSPRLMIDDRFPLLDARRDGVTDRASSLRTCASSAVISCQWRRGAPQSSIAL